MAVYSTSVLTTCTHICMHHINSIHSRPMLPSNTHASHEQRTFLLTCFFYRQLQTKPPSTPPFLSSHSHTTPTSFTGYYWFFCLGFAFSSLEVHFRNKITGYRGAWYFLLGQAQKLSSHACPISIRKELSSGQRPRKWRSLAGNWKASQAGNGKHAQAWHWQTFPSRELAKRPRQGLQNVPRPGIGKRFQVVTGKRPRQGCKHARAGLVHCQAFPGRKLASIPRQATSDDIHSNAGNWQASLLQGLRACPVRALANVPRQGTIDVPRQRTVVVPRPGGTCRHCKRALCK